ncbi:MULTISPECIES: hypothetical protein [Leptolyngbya]|jgi:hypothetical protein|uniref:Uncharacterized protein n=2 Tax=Leptolyngbya boryana TaxID=1184 RepID=A0A1Z4JFT9_LEPBY|nr:MULTISPECIES: hypothetical protein [Leptolyngbya]BAY55629.1 hypothetical protein NIES2135_24530 [Leptolyngbya boryana NIES-2135]MBD1854624.1 hypothetical protein [Leptolyngbya sp. FACHB-1624]MBD2369987.1 hypothetical protein [Leptolyngbya sp. FACHB-161]MBD2376311.1 hypothetical protein [Leptolyngbya sp. FACHB-238]MBD2400586.1 hypothetical protein [Leptolyngbya sp. FACHB-239]
MSKPIFELVDELPTGGTTVKALHALDFLVPGQWQNLTGFTNTIRVVTGETDESMIQAIGERAVYLYNDESQGYQRAMWLYQTVDNAAGALGAAALANKVGQDISFLGFLSNLTPKPEKAQSIDLCVKLVVELVAFCQINGIPGDSIGDFLASLGDYSGESLMRMAALVSFDGLIPLGGDFIQKGLSTISNTTPQELEKNQSFSSVQSLIPGNDAAGKLGFIGQSFDSVKGWMGDFVSSRNLSQQTLLDRVRGVVDVSADKLDYVGAFLDVAVKYYTHTGTQTLARRLVERAVAEI